MGPTQELIDELYVAQVLAARQRTFEQKFLAGGELYEAVIERMKAGILMQNPGATEEEIAKELQRRFAISRLLEDCE
jgi:hypothetical protein